MNNVPPEIEMDMKTSQLIRDFSQEAHDLALAVSRKLYNRVQKGEILKMIDVFCNNWSLYVHALQRERGE